MEVHVLTQGYTHTQTLTNTLSLPRRFRMLAEHFLTMYPNLNIDIDGELEQLKVRTSHHVEPRNTDRSTYDSISEFSCSALIF